MGDRFLELIFIVVKFLETWLKLLGRHGKSMGLTGLIYSFRKRKRETANGDSRARLKQNTIFHNSSIIIANTKAVEKNIYLKTHRFWRLFSQLRSVLYG